VEGRGGGLLGYCGRDRTALGMVAYVKGLGKAAGGAAVWPPHEACEVSSGR